MLALIDGMPGPERAAYERMEHRQKFAAWPGRVLVVYDMTPAGPENVDTLLFRGIDIDRHDGPRVTVEALGRVMIVRPTPARVGDRELFLQVPTSFELEWKAQQRGGSPLEYQPHYAVLAKVAKKGFEPGYTYCVTLNDFRGQYPDLNFRV